MAATPPFCKCRRLPRIEHCPQFRTTTSTLENIMKRLQDKVALVTGGSRGIGAGIVQAFLREGATVAFSGTSSATLAQASRTFGAEPQHGFLSDLSKPEAAAQLVDAVLEHFGRIDILVNNAGVVSRTDEWTLSPEEWDRVHDVNLRATFFVARDCAIVMKKNG
jgi:NAD(P)-dependent dehydrogenase (short-subunit alcohol dehydrogenase family)